jgi:hypothetical protein
MAEDGRGTHLLVTRHTRHEQWLDDLSYLEIDLTGVLGVLTTDVVDGLGVAG